MEKVRINLIGRKVEIVDSSNETLKGIKGKVVDETKNLLMIDTGKKVKKVLKKEVRFRVTTNEGLVIIDGQVVVGRPEERLKKKGKVKSRW